MANKLLRRKSTLSLASLPVLGSFISTMFKLTAFDTRSMYFAGKECKKPQAPKDGRSTGKSYEVGKVVRFRCNPGYQHEGLVAITCLPSLRWSARPPKCKPFKQGNL